jgi:hypothetical protein
LNDDINPCSLAYIATYEGAVNYIEHVNKYVFKYATDGNFNKYLLSKNIMYSSYDVLCTGNSDFKSDVFEMDYIAVARDMFDILNML